MQEARALAILSAGLRRKKREFNLVEVAAAISSLIRLYGSKDEVAQRAQVSVGMLGKFLAVSRLDRRVLDLVKARKIDRVMDIFWLSRVRDKDRQFELARIVANEYIRTNELRDIVSILNKVRRTSLKTVVSRVKAARPVEENLYAVVMPTVASNGSPHNLSMEDIQRFTSRLPNSGVKVSSGAMVVFFTEEQYRNALKVAKREGIDVTQLGWVFLGFSPGGS